MLKCHPVLTCHSVLKWRCAFLTPTHYNYIVGLQQSFPIYFANGPHLKKYKKPWPPSTRLLKNDRKYHLRSFFVFFFAFYLQLKNIQCEIQIMASSPSSYPFAARGPLSICHDLEGDHLAHFGKLEFFYLFCLYFLIKLVILSWLIFYFL